MVTVKILGPGCANCKHLEAIVRDVARSKTYLVEIQKVTEFFQIMQYRILGTPGLVVNEVVKSAGHIPTNVDISAWLDAAESNGNHGAAL